MSHACRGLWIAGKARQASILPPVWPRIDGFRSLDRWTANLRSLDSPRRLAPRRARNALILLRSPRAASPIARFGSRVRPRDRLEIRPPASPIIFDSTLPASLMNSDSADARSADHAGVSLNVHNSAARYPSARFMSNPSVRRRATGGPVLTPRHSSLAKRDSASLRYSSAERSGRPGRNGPTALGRTERTRASGQASAVHSAS